MVMNMNFGDGEGVKKRENDKRTWGEKNGGKMVKVVNVSFC